MIRQKTIILVWGAQGSGKSSTIKFIREELIKKHINPHHTYSFPPVGPDINDQQTCAGHRIGIVSMGDHLEDWLRDLLIDFTTTSNCDIIICASRVYNNVADFVEDLARAHNYRLFKATNYRARHEPDATKDALNLKSALQIIELTDDLMAGII